MDHETAFVQAFIVADKRERYLAKLASHRHRQKFLDRLNHCPDIDFAFATRVSSGEQKAAQIEKILRSHGAPDTCHLISDNSKWDQKDLPLGEALALVCGSSIGTIVSCTPGRLAYYEAEEMSHRFILRAK